jgi:hypothetical protein
MPVSDELIAEQRAEARAEDCEDEARRRRAGRRGAPSTDCGARRSAVMALLHDEDGSSTVVEAIADGATISVVDWAEVLSNVAADGDDSQEVVNRLSVTGEEVVRR